MLKRRKEAVWIALFAILLLAYGFAGWQSSQHRPDHPAIKAGSQGTQSTGAPNRPAEIFSQPTAEDRIATYTLWLALFTFALVAVSSVQIRFLIRADKTARITAEAAGMQARAAISVELPVVFVTGVVLRASSSSGVEVNLPTVKCRFHIRYDNYGRTPAIITSECLDWQICPTLPPDPLYQRIYPASTGAIVRPNDHRVIDRETFDVDFSEQQILDVGNDRSRLWVYGFVSFRDFLGQRHQTGFCARWVKGDPTIGRSFRFVEDGPPNYRYQR